MKLREFEKHLDFMIKIREQIKQQKIDMETKDARSKMIVICYDNIIEILNQTNEYLKLISN